MFNFNKKKKADKLYVAKHLIKNLIKDIEKSGESPLIGIRLKDILKRLEK